MLSCLIAGTSGSLPQALADQILLLIEPAVQTDTLAVISNKVIDVIFIIAMPQMNVELN